MMELTREQQLYQQIINEAWENESFKEELLVNPIQAIETLTGKKLNIPEGKTLVVRDQTDENAVYINIPAAVDTANVELSEEQLEAVAGGIEIPIIKFGDPQIWDPTIWIDEKAPDNFPFG
ncbi:NHLP leader peptide family RiPP precursor [Aquimarina sp. ERC-38]|uniref:NHLP leader peptide family RiPP precursor n=1 Tax=Aquimarina sp. ERC-38 TaxID=2949996 RepID=UPI00224667F2|nr:NHLP leader peptide family RiPP precursor [Aquimarina sp. ERC-38]UZO82189.1 NHLP leader peptide family RiPP precursor [Aquimarina sp. ERC-38]